MDIGTILLLASLLMGAVIGDAALFGKTMRVHFTLPASVTSQGMTQEAAEQIFISEFARLADIAYILPFPTIAQANKDSLLSVVAKPLKIDPVVEVVQGKFGSDMVSMKFAMVNGPGSGEITLLSMVTNANGQPLRFSISGPEREPDRLVEAMARRIASETLPYRVALSDYEQGVRGDPTGFERAKALCEKALAHGFDRSTATQRVMLYNTLGLIAVHHNDLAAAERLWTTGMQVPYANGTAYAIIAANRAFLAIARRDPVQARAMHDTAMSLRTLPYLAYFDHHLEMLDSLITWAEGDLTAADDGLAMVGQRLVADTALTYRAHLAAVRGRTEEAQVMAERAVFLKTLKHIHPDLAGSVFWVNPAEGGIELRQ
ncbi:MAG: hypothetical protein AB7F35_28255 [Acetobacteraceae bacterium]